MSSDTLHNDMGNIVSFIDYVAGRRQGVYFPNPIPNYLVKQTQATAAPNTRPLDVMRDELYRFALPRNNRYLFQVAFDMLKEITCSYISCV